MSITSPSGFSPQFLVNGLISGINTQQVISALLQSYELPVTNLENQQSQINSQVKDWQAINKDIAAFQTAAQSLSTPSGWNLMTASSSDTSVATATATAGAASGSLTFSVNQLAQAEILASQNSVSSTSTSITSDSQYLLSKGAENYGFQWLATVQGSGLALGSHSIQVTQASQAATITGTAALTSQSFTTSDNTLGLTVNGTAYSLTLPTGTTLSPSQIVSDLNSAASSAGAPVNFSLNSSGELVVSTNDSGSADTLEINSSTATTDPSTAAAALDLPTGTTVSGVNAVVNVDGTSNTITNIAPGGEVQLTSGDSSGGSIEVKFAGATGPNGSTAALSTGTVSATNISLGNGSLGDVVNNINAAGAGVTASAVQTSSGAYILQLASSTTGTDGQITVPLSGADAYNPFGTVLGNMNAIQSAQNAQISVGGTSGYTLSSQTDTFNNVMPGTNVTVTGTGSTTITVAPNAAGQATQVQNLVTAANQVLSDIQKYAGYNDQSKVAGPLMGNAILQGIQGQILSTFATNGGTSNLGNALAAGISVTSNGTISFNQTTFESEFAAHPHQVAALFEQGIQLPSGSPYTSEISLVYASNQTQPGTYALTVTQPALQATDTGDEYYSSPTSTVSTAETLTVGSGGATATYATTVGETLSAIAQGLNQTFANNSMALSAQVVDTTSGYAVQVTSNSYGGSAGFTLSSTASGTGTTGLAAAANTTYTYAGQNVAGYIDVNGTDVYGTGNGQYLAFPTTNSPLAGLDLQITTPGTLTYPISTNITYVQGLGQQLSSQMYAASSPINGSVTTTINSLQQQSTGLDPQIAFYSQIVAQEKKTLEAQFAQMEATLGSLKNQGAMLSSSIAQLPGL
ncbi:MAG: flagellar filament capping protein FliD [Actinobacteria bacterium]|nr:flagellar filament capping protein FliD [Actinomycetota bacterium]